jgi:uncharacterized membrane-anchored protein
VAWGEVRVASGLAVLLLATIPFWMVILERRRRPGQRLDLRVRAGLLLGLAGVALLVGPGRLLRPGIDPLGAAALLLASVSWAFGSIQARAVKRAPSTILTAAMQLLSGGVLLLLAGLAAGQGVDLRAGALSPLSIASLAYLIVFGSIVGFTAYVWLLEHTSAARLATYAYVNPVIAVLLGWAAAGERQKADTSSHIYMGDNVHIRTPESILLDMIPGADPRLEKKRSPHMSQWMRFQTLAVAAAAVLMLAAPASAQEGPNVEWVQGPSLAQLGDIAQVSIPYGYQFADADDSRALLEMMGNPTSGRELGIVAPASGEWFVVFEFSDIGYVKDDEKDSLDADSILETITEGNDAANEERQRRGWSTLKIEGWEQAPHYNEATNNLEWAIRGSSADGMVVNYNTRLLGRNGVMEVALVVEPAKLAQSLPQFNTLLSNYSYNSGQKYAEFVSGDKIAQYGLAALVAGGAAAAAVKSGLFAQLIGKLWKLIVVVFIAIGSCFKKLLNAMRGERASTSQA